MNMELILSGRKSRKLDKNILLIVFSTLLLFGCFQRSNLELKSEYI